MPMKTAETKQRVKREVLLLLGVYYPAHHSGVARYAREAGWVLDHTYIRSGGMVPVAWRGDGMITLITRPKDYEALRLFPPLPLVDLSRGWVTNAMPPRLRRTGRDRPRVLYDNPMIGRLAAEHFLERGFRHLALFNVGNYWMETDRLPTFREAIEAAGAQYHELPYYEHLSAHETYLTGNEKPAYRWLVEEIRRLPKPVGIFASADDVTIKLLRACGDAGASVPEEVAVLGCDNEPMICEHAPVPLSSVDPDLEQQGYVAAQLLDRLMNGEPPPKDPILIPPKGVVVRQSTNILAVPHVHVARALRFIWEHYQEPIQTPDIAAFAGMSLRGLERIFRQHLQRTMVAELIRCRIEHARELLATTDLKIYEVAHRCGFSDLAYFSNVFHQHAGIRPGHFRRQQRPKE
jgi:LacI family transcriptional regulator